MSTEKILIHISGLDKPGVTAFLLKQCLEYKAKILDIGQSVLHGNLNLSALVELVNKDSFVANIKSWVNEQELNLSIRSLQSADQNNESLRLKNSFCVTMIGDLHNHPVLSKLTKILADKKLNIVEIKTLTNESLSGVEFTVHPKENRFNQESFLSSKQAVLSLANKNKIDIAFQKNNIFRKNKNLVCFDVDSTFINAEVIDELADLLDKKAHVAKITQSAMNGDIDFPQALIERVKLLEGLRVDKAIAMAKQLPLSKGVVDFAKVLKKLGLKVGLVSGGFDFFVNILKEKYNLDFGFANQLEVRNGKFTGKVIGEIVGPARKAQILRDMAQVYSISLDQCVAVGDGANDIEMLKAAGLGIAYDGKKALKDVAHGQINSQNMHSMFFLLGYHNLEIQDFLK